MVYREWVVHHSKWIIQFLKSNAQAYACFFQVRDVTIWFVFFKTMCDLILRVIWLIHAWESLYACTDFSEREQACIYTRVRGRKNGWELEENREVESLREIEIDGRRQKARERGRESGYGTRERERARKRQRERQRERERDSKGERAPHLCVRVSCHAFIHKLRL